MFFFVLSECIKGMEDPVEAADNPHYVIDITLDGTAASPEERDIIFGGTAGF